MPVFSKYIICAVFLCYSQMAWNQNTVGVISYDPELSFPGYNLVFPHGQGTVWLINECGEVVNRWDDDQNRVPGNSVYLQDNGDLLVCYNRRGSNTDPIWAGGAGQYVELRSWDNDLIWEFELNDSLKRIHHDVTRMQNGNVLMIAWENKTPEESIENGRDSLLITEGAIWPDYILEFDPALDSIVWEWHAWDHLVQEYDSTKQNFGVIADSPELININHIYVSGQADWMHTNAIDYNPELDLIMLSVPHFDEIWFIDHSTTQEESNGSDGGYWRKGGDLVYRWGNPRAYHRGDSSDQKLFFTHDTHWVEDFVDEEYPLFGSVALFNNRFGNNISVANIFTPVVDTTNRTFGLIGDAWGPADYALTVIHPEDSTLMYSSGLSSFQVLPNDNYLILVGRSGYAFELTPQNEIVWEYIVPIKNGAFISQGETPLNNTTFRMKRYPVDYSAFDGRDLSSQGYLELNPDTAYCELLISATDHTSHQQDVLLYPNPAINTILIERATNERTSYRIINAIGIVVKSGMVDVLRAEIMVNEFENGHYTLLMDGYIPFRFVIHQ
ncbi:MAG: aryl-sulfate sulfotransferase [Saprospiraceae bacterium]